MLHAAAPPTADAARRCASHSYQEQHRPPLLVTASVDAIELAALLDISQDLTISGKVAWTGRSSLDIRMELQQGQQASLVALFSFVALDPVTKKAIAINPLKPATQQDQQRFDERQRVADGRRAARQAQAAAVPAAGGQV